MRVLFYGDCGAPQSPILCALRREGFFRQAEPFAQHRVRRALLYGTGILLSFPIIPMQGAVFLV